MSDYLNKKLDTDLETLISLVYDNVVDKFADEIKTVIDDLDKWIESYEEEKLWLDTPVAWELEALKVRASRLTLVSILKDVLGRQE